MPDRIRTWRRAGYRAVGVRKEPGSVMMQIDYLRSHGLYIDESCKGTIDEICGWSWQRDGISGKYLDIPVCVHDDAMAALRYATEPLRKGVARTIDARKLGL